MCLTIYHFSRLIFSLPPPSLLTAVFFHSLGSIKSVCLNVCCCAEKKIPVRFSPPLPPPFSFSPLEPKLSAKQNALPHNYIHQLSHNVKRMNSQIKGCLIQIIRITMTVFRSAEFIAVLVGRVAAFSHVPSLKRRGRQRADEEGGGGEKKRKRGGKEQERQKGDNGGKKRRERCSRARESASCRLLPRQ